MKATILSIRRESVWFVSDLDDPENIIGSDCNIYALKECGNGFLQIEGFRLSGPYAVATCPFCIFGAQII